MCWWIIPLWSTNSLRPDEAQVSINVLIKIDCGYHRAGLLPDSPELYPLAQAIVQAPYLHFLGVLAHGGHAYDCLGAEAIRSVAESERFETVRAAESLRAQGIDVEVASGTSECLSARRFRIAGWL